MPRLIRGVARTAVIAGTATAVSNNVSRRQAQRWSQQAPAAQQQAQAPQPAAPAPAPAPAPAAAPSMDDTIEQLRKLGGLRDAGILTDAEFEAQKARLLG